MRKYYIVTSKIPESDMIEIKLTDNKNGYNVIFEVEAKTYCDALRKIRFSKNFNGGSKIV